MKFRNLRKNVKAISPVIATLLMIAVAVVASLVAYAWVMGYIGGQTAKTGNAIQIQSMSNSTGLLTIYVQNIGDGSVDLNAQSVYVNNAQATITAGTGTIPAQSTATITTNYSLMTTGTQSTTVTVKVVTTSGTFSEVVKTFP